MYSKSIATTLIALIMTSLPLFSQNEEKCVSGDCKNGKGVLIDKEGDKIKGSFVNGKLEGFGEIEFKNGAKFFGVFKNGEKNGKGKLILPEDKIEYDGEWIANGVCITGDCLNGSGTLRKFYPNLNETCDFSGTFLSGKINGKGKYLCTDKEAYDGDMKDSKPHGTGIISYSDGKKYEGEFQNSEYEGKGIFTWKAEDTECVFHGTFKKNKRYGKGFYTCKDGEKFEGLYADDLPNGKGKLTDPDGSKYEGDFKDGRPHGKGTRYDSSGTVTETGIFKNGYRHFKVPTFDFIEKTWAKPEKWFGGSLEKTQVLFMEYLANPDLSTFQIADEGPELSDLNPNKTYVEARVSGFYGTIILCIDKKYESAMDKFLTKPLVIIEFDGRIVGYYDDSDKLLNKKLIVDVENVSRMGYLEIPVKKKD
ncbi:MORN repeat-containing protein [Leptospira sanjuanensis]|uniref:MORN repeat-containing protein n=1 Tax=Leptospira sanjuanensis TaxID=2879643 RepID=UPI001EE96BD9|nr:membrane-binding protein [Leptospira sanjuanensis]MCG6169147.1 membrane-binding protein [Leptospira sanjuanensis]